MPLYYPARSTPAGTGEKRPDGLKIRASGRGFDKKPANDNPPGKSIQTIGHKRVTDNRKCGRR
jgi:hypothetical protein